MRRVPVFLVMLLAITAMATPRTASAQTSAETVRPFNQLRSAAIFGPAVDPAVNTDIVIARLMTFDRDNDGRLVKGELPERMQELITRGDRNADGILHLEELRE